MRWPIDTEESFKEYTFLEFIYLYDNYPELVANICIDLDTWINAKWWMEFKRHLISDKNRNYKEWT